MSEKSDLVRIGGLWQNTNRHGEPYWSGGFGQGRILIFLNNKRPGSNDPDYVMYIAPRLAAAGEPADQDNGEIPF
jgi:hypothetical protein